MMAQKEISPTPVETCYFGTNLLWVMPQIPTWFLLKLLMILFSRFNEDITLVKQVDPYLCDVVVQIRI